MNPPPVWTMITSAIIGTAGLYVALGDLHLQGLLPATKESVIQLAEDVQENHSEFLLHQNEAYQRQILQLEVTKQDWIAKGKTRGETAIIDEQQQLLMQQVEKTLRKLDAITNTQGKDQ